MQYGVVLNYNTNNLGDDIQTFAASKLLPRVDEFLDRENLKMSEINEKIKFICNGWYMYYPQNWPPAKNLHPLFISFHITNSNNSYRKMVSKDLINYYKKFEPIGCRDTYTLNLFKAIGIKAYLSGCLTLTLDNPFSKNERNKDIIVVDPFMFYMKKEFKEHIIKKLVPNSFHKNIKYISHYIKYPLDSIEQRMDYTKNILDIYAKAHVVITSRIHAALPAMALGTPVIFIDLGYNSIKSRSRFGGILELFNILDNSNLFFTDKSYFSRFYRKLNIYKLYYPMRNFKFEWDNPPPPPREINEIANKIKKKVNMFIDFD